MFVFKVFLVPIFSHSDWIRRDTRDIQSECGKLRTRKIPNTDTFHAMKNNRLHCLKICMWNVEFFWSALFRNWTEYGDIQSEFLHFVQKRKNTTKKSLFGNYTSSFDVLNESRRLGARYKTYSVGYLSKRHLKDKNKTKLMKD